jgi:hypothetical protein
MATALRFVGRDLRNLIATLAKAIELADAGETPCIEANSIVYRFGDLSALAALMPDVPLSAQHQAIVDAVLPTDKRRKPASYRRTAVILAQRCGRSSMARTSP